MKSISSVILSFLFVFSFSTVHAAVFNPSTSAQLQADLTTAETNGEDDTINLPAGNFFTADNGGGMTFTFNSGENQSLSIIGAGVGSTILDGNTARQVMLLNNAGGANANVTVSGITFQNGDGMGGAAGGLGINSDDGNVTVEDSEFLNNQNNGGSFGGLYVSTNQGNVLCNNNSLTGNMTSSDFAGAYCNSGNGNVEFNNNTVSGNTATDSFGGFFANSGMGSVTCNNNTVTNNTASNGSFGGSFCNTGTGDVSFVGNTADNNRAPLDDFGGSFVNTANGNVTCENNSVTNNQAGGRFGGIYCNIANGNLSFTGNLVENNQAMTDSFGGFFANTAMGSVNCNDNQVLNNRALESFGGGFCNAGNGDVAFINNTANDNRAQNDSFGGMFVNTGAGAVMIERNTFLRNTAGMTFGGLQGSNGTGPLSFINNIVAHNEATADNFGGAFLSANQPLYIINNSFFENRSAGIGGGLFVGANNMASTANLFNNISYGNTSGMMGSDIYVGNSSMAAIMLFNNDFTEFCSDDPISCDPADLGANQGANKNVDPLFQDPVAGNFNLQAASPVIDMGTAAAPMLPPIDRVGNPRIFGPEPDMGALEAVALLDVNPLNLDFGEIAEGNESGMTVTITNLGNFEANVTGLTLSDVVNFLLNVNGGANPCGSETFTLSAGQSCTVEIIFLPQGTGLFNATLDVLSDDPNNPVITVTLTGSGAQVSLSGSGCSLGMASANSSWATLLLGPLLGLIFRFRRKSGER